MSMNNLSSLEFSPIEHFLTAAFLAAAAAALLLAVIKSLRQRGLGRSATFEATVVSKYTEDYVSQPIFMQDKQVNTGFVEKGLLYSILFRTAKGKEVAFPVSRQFYEQVAEGQTDTLRCKGAKLLQFGRLQNEKKAQGADFKNLQDKL